MLELVEPRVNVVVRRALSQLLRLLHIAQCQRVNLRPHIVYSLNKLRKYVRDVFHHLHLKKAWRAPLLRRLEKEAQNTLFKFY